MSEVKGWADWGKGVIGIKGSLRKVLVLCTDSRLQGCGPIRCRMGREAGVYRVQGVPRLKGVSLDGV